MRHRPLADFRFRFPVARNPFSVESGCLPKNSDCSLTMRFSIIPCGWLAEQDTFVRNCDAAPLYLLVFDGRKSEKGERLESEYRLRSGATRPVFFVRSYIRSSVQSAGDPLPCREPMRHHPDTDRLRRVLEKCLPKAVAWNGELFRSASPKYANKDDFITGAGSKAAGARWNPPGGVHIVYASLEVETAVAESVQHFRYYGLPLSKAMPRVIVALETKLECVLDLRDGDVRRVLVVSEKRLLSEPWREEQKKGREALTQAIGRLAYELGIEALLVPSAALKGGSNLLVFPANLDPPKIWLRIVDRRQSPAETLITVNMQNCRFFRLPFFLNRPIIGGGGSNHGDEICKKAKPTTPPIRKFAPKQKATDSKGTTAVEEVRRNLGLTRKLFSRLTGYSERAIASWEAGRKPDEPGLRRSGRPSGSRRSSPRSSGLRRSPTGSTRRTTRSGASSPSK